MKSVLKAVAGIVATIIVSPALAMYWIGGRLFGAEKAFQGWSQCLSLIPGLTGEYLRQSFYRGVFERCGAGATISFGTIFSHPTCSLGRNVYIGAFCCLGEVTLEDDVLLGSHVSIMNGSGQHGISRLDIPIREQPGEWPHITIGRDTWIGDRAIVMADVGRHSVIGAGSVVTKPIPDFAVAAGVPARVIRFRGPSSPEIKSHISEEVEQIGSGTSR
jgi:acetyltransferase-like isoleucine patch superfamily enzyme